jgi:hypothetical protein
MIPNVFLVFFLFSFRTEWTLHLYILALVEPISVLEAHVT